MYCIFYHLIAGLACLAVRSGRAKDLEIIVLRHQLTVLRRQVDRPAINDDDRTLLGAVGQALPRPRRVGWLVTPESLLRWHRQRIARHWTYPTPRRGRPPTAAKLRQLIVAMATENPTWGYQRIHGELAGLGHHLAALTVWQILKTNNIDPAPNRTAVTWTQFLKSQAAVACDFATVDTALLHRYYLLFFIDIQTRTVFYAGVTTNPTGLWTTQAARNLFLRHGEQLTDARALVRDRGSQFTTGFDEVFRTEGIKVLKTPVRHTGRQLLRGTMDRDTAPRTVGPHHHLEPATPRSLSGRIHRPLQHPPSPPVPRTATATIRPTQTEQR